MYYKDRASELKMIETRSSDPIERASLTLLCNAYWDVFAGKTVTQRMMSCFEEAANSESELLVEWAFIGMVIMSEFHKPFEFLVFEHLQANQAFARQKARHLHRLSKNTKAVLSLLLISSNEVRFRSWALKELECQMNEPSEIREFLPICSHVALREQNDEVGKSAKKLVQSKKRALSKVRVSQDFFDWEKIGATLDLALRSAIAALPPEFSRRDIYTACLQANPIYGEVLISFDCEMRDDRWNVGEWTHISICDDYDPVGRAFETEWREMQANIESNISEDSKRPWLFPAAPEAHFLQMVRKCAKNLQSSSEFKKLKLANDFFIFGLGHEENIEKAVFRQKKLGVIF